MKFLLRRGSWRKRTDNRRKYVRQGSFIIAEYTVQQGTFRDIIRNLSAGGLFINTHRKFRAGQPIILNFPLVKFDETIDADGTIIRIDKDGFAVTFLNPIDYLICEDGQFPKIVHEADRKSE